MPLYWFLDRHAAVTAHAQIDRLIVELLQALIELFKRWRVVCEVPRDRVPKIRGDNRILDYIGASRLHERPGSVERADLRLGQDERVQHVRRAERRQRLIEQPVNPCLHLRRYGSHAIYFTPTGRRKDIFLSRVFALG